MLVTSPFLISVPSLEQIRQGVSKTETSTVIWMRSSSSSPAPSMEDDPRKRVVVCDGGVIGVCTVYFLAKKGAAVTLLEQSSVACAASGKSGGFLALEWCDGGPLSALSRTSFNLHRSLAQDLDGPQSYGYRPFTTAVADGGVEVVIRKLESVEVEQGEATAVVIEGGRKIGANAVVLALGPWSGKLSILSSIFRVYGLKAHSVVVEPKEAGAISPHTLFLSYKTAQGGEAMDPEVYPRPTGEVYICEMSAQVEVPDDPEQVVGNPESIAVLKRVAETVSSHLRVGEATVKAEQACFLPCTEDSVPVIGEVPGIKVCYVATGHSFWGILNDPATGAAVAELVLDGRASIVDLSPFSPDRFIGGR